MSRYLVAKDNGWTCDKCTNEECEEPRKTKFGLPRYWSYMGACVNPIRKHMPTKKGSEEE